MNHFIKTKIDSTVLCLFIISLYGCSSPTTVIQQQKKATETAKPKISQRLLFANQGYIYTINTDGTDQKQLTAPAKDGTPTWSLDGQKIFFVCANAICSMNTDGSGLVNLVSGEKEPPALSSDKHRVAFSTYDKDDSTIYIATMNIDQSALKRVSLDHYQLVWNPVWSPDNLHIIFQYRRGMDDSTKLNILTLDPDNSSETSINPDEIGYMACASSTICPRDENPIWSPMGDQIAYTKVRGDAQDHINALICIAGLDGITKRCLTQDISSISWSPDEQRIAFTSNRSGKNDIYIMNENGTGVIQLTNSTTSETNLSWSPDGKQIAFSTEAGLFVMNTDGKSLHQIAKSTVCCFSAPQWQPQPKP